MEGFDVESPEFLGGTTRSRLDWGGRGVVLRTTDSLSGELEFGFEPGDTHVLLGE